MDREKNSLSNDIRPTKRGKEIFKMCKLPSSSAINWNTVKKVISVEVWCCNLKVTQKAKK